MIPREGDRRTRSHAPVCRYRGTNTEVALFSPSCSSSCPSPSSFNSCTTSTTTRTKSPSLSLGDSLGVPAVFFVDALDPEGEVGHDGEGCLQFCLVVGAIQCSMHTCTKTPFQGSPHPELASRVNPCGRIYAPLNSS